MDTKLKKSEREQRPGTAVWRRQALLGWGSFFVLLSSLLGLLSLCLVCEGFYLSREIGFTRMMQDSRLDNWQDSTVFPEVLRQRLSQLVNLRADQNSDATDMDAPWRGEMYDPANDQYYDKGEVYDKDTLYRVEDDGKTVSSNTDAALAQDRLPAGYNFWLQLTFRKGQVETAQAWQDGRRLPQARAAAFCAMLDAPGLDAGTRRVTLAVAANPKGSLRKLVIESLDMYRQAQRAMPALALAALLSLPLLLLFYPGKVEGDSAFSRLTALFPLEPKLLGLGLLALAAAIPLGVVRSMAYGLAASIILWFWLLYWTINDLRYGTFDKYSWVRDALAAAHRRKVAALRHKSRRQAAREAARRARAQTLEQRLSALHADSPFARRLANAFFPVAVTGLAVCLLTGLFSAIRWGAPGDVLACVALLALLAYVLYRFYRYLLFQGEQTGALLAQIEKMGRGEEPRPITVGGGEELSKAAYDLAAVQRSVARAVEARVKSERMKVDLITNVSHDLKTPLTSIISYLELLQEETLPPAARDYVQVLVHKSDRLKHIVQDVFDISKAATGNLPVNLKPLDLAKLIRQTMADMDTEVKACGLDFRLQLPQAPVWVQADGDRLYRVFQNLFQNVMRYSLENSRVYVNLSVQEKRATAIVRNTSREALGDVRDLMGRFVRGDQNRSSEGSGLGLSIAQTFTQACGGNFEVRAEADLFIAQVHLPVSKAPSPQPVQAPV